LEFSGILFCMLDVLDPVWIAAFSLLLMALGAVLLVMKADLPGM
jgi:hypothetical protein